MRANDVIQCKLLAAEPGDTGRLVTLRDLNLYFKSCKKINLRLPLNLVIPIGNTMPKLSILLSGLVFWCSAAATYASPISYEFNLNWISGELAGSSSAGQFTFDSSWVKPGEQVGPPNLFTHLDFTVRNLHFTEATIPTGLIRFDEIGEIRGMFFGNNCIIEFDAVSSCGASSGNRDEFLYKYFVGLNRLSVIGDGWYPNGQTGFSTATSTLRRLRPLQGNEINEPYTPWLLLTGLGLMSIARSKTLYRRVRRQYRRFARELLVRV